MRRIANHCLVEIANLHLHPTLVVGQWPEVAEVAVTTDPYGGSLRNRPTVLRLQPFVELHGVAAHIGMGGSRHLRILQCAQQLGPVLHTYCASSDFHGCPEGETHVRGRQWNTGPGHRQRRVGNVLIVMAEL